MYGVETSFCFRCSMARGRVADRLAGLRERERKLRAIAISPAPNRSCYTAEITSLLVRKHSILAG
jgi:hypothetical protein